MEEEPIGSTAVIKEALGGPGVVAFRDLSAVSHGELFGLTARVEKVQPVPGLEGMTFVTSGASFGRIVGGIAAAVEAHQQAQVGSAGALPRWAGTR